MNTDLLQQISALELVGGKTGSCVPTTRDNLNRVPGISGIPQHTSDDQNSSRGFLVQLLNSGGETQWSSMKLDGAELHTFTSGYGTATAYVMSGTDFENLVRSGQVPDGAVIFQTKHDLDSTEFNTKSSGSDIGILRNGGLFNFEQNKRPTVYNANDRGKVVVILPTKQ